MPNFRSFGASSLILGLFEVVDTLTNAIDKCEKIEAGAKPKQQD